MNWYKKAQVESYYEIGHGLESILWAYLEGKIQYHGVNKPNQNHPEIWPKLEDNDYWGRYDLDTRLCSIINPEEGRPIPNPILRGLYDTFGNNIKIVEFN